MAHVFSRLIEAQIKKAQSKGQLQNLPGEGKPLPARPEEAYLDVGEAVGHRIMAEAGVLPREVQLKHALDEARAHLQSAAPEDRKVAQARVADLEMRYALAREARLKVMRG